MQFEHLGFYKEYYVGNKFIGKIETRKDREEIGYSGRKKELLSADVDLGKGKKLKAGAEVITMIYPLCGKSIK
ncbi:hypothetical protein UFOVP1605_4 [uncultured Caudovirales phage]|uniref:Uncharacterized protein n=1 Tax=uncultured Caudovirales phage TaxID=2100421 RepID=A0A6J5SRK1_9CAUD|nr:hypothetical protein UFOVP1605_4 [uncultured Caudovirales phage]